MDLGDNKCLCRLTTVVSTLTVVTITLDPGSKGTWEISMSLTQRREISMSLTSPKREGAWIHWELRD